MPPKPPRPDLTQLSDTDKDRLIDALFARLDAVEARLGMNSDNSSKPPPSDGLTKKTSLMRESSGKKAGGQKGRKATTLRQAEQPDEVVKHPLPGPPCVIHWPASACHVNRVGYGLPVTFVHQRKI